MARKTERSTYAKRERRNAQRQRDDEVRRVRFPTTSTEGTLTWTEVDLAATYAAVVGANVYPPQVAFDEHFGYMRGRFGIVLPADYSSGFPVRFTFDNPTGAFAGEELLVGAAVAGLASLPGSVEAEPNVPDWTAALQIRLNVGTPGNGNCRVNWHDHDASILGNPTIYLDGVNFSLRV